MMEQYVNTKEEYKDCILFYRLGDFYEMFFEDAKLASRELELTLTGRDCGLPERAPMCGVPYHACDTYINQLISKGYKVAICEQVEDPKLAKGLVKREVIRVVTPGTNMSDQVLTENMNNYLMCIYVSEDKGNLKPQKSVFNLAPFIGVSLCDISTGEFKTCELSDSGKLSDEIFKFTPSEIICNERMLSLGLDIPYMRDRLKITISTVNDHYFDKTNCENGICEHFHTKSLEGFGLSEYPQSVRSSGALLKYILETQKNSMEHISELLIYSVDDFMLLDNATRRNLELTETLRDKTKKGSLLGILDKTKTAMGARLLRRYIEQPLISKKQIEDRLDALSAINDDMMKREEIREYLIPVYDLERLMTRISLRTANPRDLIAFKTSLTYLPDIKRALKDYNSTLLKDIYEKLDVLSDLHDLIDKTLIDEPPILIREGGLIKDGFSADVDMLKKAKTDGKLWLAELEEKERDASGIKNLKIKFNKVFGYYFEVTNSYKDLVPEHFIRKQTLANAERFTTEELNELADTILGAEDKMNALEYEEYVKLRDELAGNLKRVQRTADSIARLDVLISLAYVSEHNRYVRPTINEEGVIDIKDGRHPVVEKMIPNDLFIANDTLLDLKDQRISIITGPNMAGKSTYMRQSALIVLMAQIGCCVPAASANIGLVDRIFTRVGASDDLSSGQSTFMVEMNEVANILRNATPNSLLILDEIGRGTSTFDGLSIAWAVVEYISSQIGAKTLFATHYHELTELEGGLSGVNNYCIAVKEQGENIIFLRKIIKGGADRSYGIQVARLAGVPRVVIDRAMEIASELSDSDIAANAKNIKAHSLKKKKEENVQLSLFANQAESELIAELKGLDLSNMTPMKALMYLNSLQEKLL
ncbi:MAG: DNA mismatch repair protein MutS [Lachnospiraceae bacterium]|nr:DNA mismatch repair protein MutS [Lachnospiraceae bacterium]